MKKLSDISIIKSGNHNSGDMDNIGLIPFYSCGARNPVGTHSKETFDEKEYILLISAGGSENNKLGENVGLGKVFYIKGKSSCMTQVSAIFVIADNVNVTYLYYYLKFIRLQIVNLAKFTTNLGRISKSQIEEIAISIPPAEIQQKFIEYHINKESLIEQKKQNIETIKLMIEDMKTSIKEQFE
jgi:restriction endonuclease S subunit